MKSPTIDDYLDQLERELADLPPARRRELIDELKTHIDEALAATPHASEADVRNVLDQLGDPAEIASEARGGAPRPDESERVKARWTDWAAVVLLPFGVLLVLWLSALWPRVAALSPLGWLLGVVFLAMSKVWTLRDKLIGALLFPGGEALPFIALGLPAKTCTVGDGVSTCTGFSLSPWIGIPVLLILVVTPIAVAVYLASKLQRGR
jgi:uncharacterized membrane protein